MKHPVMEQKMKKYYHIYILISFGILVWFGLQSFVKPQKSYSEQENRYLEQYPSWSMEDFMEGEFQDKLETAMSDQFLGREKWMSFSTSVEKLAGYREIADIYIGKDGYYFAKKTQDMTDQKQYNKNLHYVEYLGTQMTGKTSLLLVPSPASVLPEKLPELASYYDADGMYQTAKTIVKSAVVIDTRKALKKAKKKEQVYYKTDHHWTLWGAYTAYRSFCQSVQIQAKSYSYFAPKKVTEEFYGTMYSKVLDKKAAPDTIYAAQNLPEVTTESDGQKGQGVYDVPKLKQKDKYAYFFGGNFGKVRIKTGNGNKKLLVVKDSYANSFVPFLLEDYDEIVMIDLRYYRDSVKELLQEEVFDEALVLYEMSNFAEESSLYRLVY